MNQYDNNLKGILGQNDYKKKETQPDYTGKCEIEGRQYSISGWVKQSKDGSKSFLSLSFQDKSEGQQSQSQAASLGGDTPF
jgi:hypothetical protein